MGVGGMGGGWDGRGVGGWWGGRRLNLHRDTLE